MSFDLFVVCFRDGQPATLQRSLIEEVLGNNAVSPSFPLTDVKYPDGSGGEIYGAEDDEATSLMFTHFGGDMMFSAIHELAERTGSAIYWPDTRPALAVTNASVVDHIPGDCVEAIGPAYIAKDYRSLMDYIARPEED